MNQRIYDFAFSFAGEDREIVEDIAKCLKGKKYSVFYDYDYQHELLGQDLYRFLRAVYRDKGKFVVCFLSEHYQKKVWTNLEMTAVKERLMNTFFADDFLIPIWLDSSMNIDIPTFWGSYRHRSVQETADILDRKFKSSLKEDVFMENIDKFIEYLCNQIEQYLLTKKVDVLRETPQCVCIRNSDSIKRLTLGCDEFCYTPYVTIHYEEKSKNNFLQLPDLLLTWEKNGLLQFTVYSFQASDNEFVTHLSFDDLIRFLIHNTYGLC